MEVVSGLPTEIHLDIDIRDKTMWLDTHIERNGYGVIELKISKYQYRVLVSPTKEIEILQEQHFSNKFIRKFSGWTHLTRSGLPLLILSRWFSREVTFSDPPSTSRNVCLLTSCLGLSFRKCSLGHKTST